MHGVFEETTLLFLTILLSAKLFGVLFTKLGLPEIIGELLAGLVLGNLHLIGIEITLVERLLSNDFLQYAAELGVVILLFQVGLETELKKFIQVGLNATSVAFVGVILPVILGFLLAQLLGVADGIAAWFIGATFAATSVGITAKIMRERHVLGTGSAQVILGAAVIDDVLGIIILTVLAGIATTGEFTWLNVGTILFKSALFFVLGYSISRVCFKGIIEFNSRLNNTGLWMFFAMVLVLGFAELATWAQLAPIIGAFAAGLFLENKHFVKGHAFQKHNLEEMLKPIMDIMLPIFFVSIGCQVKLDVLSEFSNIFLVVALLFIAVLTKLAAGFVVRGPGFDKWGIGMGMVPRGEVGLIFAAYALNHKVFDTQQYSLLVLVVFLTTLIGPLLLRYRLSKF